MALLVLFFAWNQILVRPKFLDVSGPYMGQQPLIGMTGGLVTIGADSM